MKYLTASIINMFIVLNIIYVVTKSNIHNGEEGTGMIEATSDYRAYIAPLLANCQYG